MERARFQTRVMNIAPRPSLFLPPVLFRVRETQAEAGAREGGASRLVVRVRLNCHVRLARHLYLPVLRESGARKHSSRLSRARSRLIRAELLIVVVILSHLHLRICRPVERPATRPELLSRRKPLKDIALTNSIALERRRCRRAKHESESRFRDFLGDN